MGEKAVVVCMLLSLFSAASLCVSMQRVEKCLSYVEQQPPVEMQDALCPPDVPYSDELMKEVFRLTISAFEGLSDNSSKSFAKRV